MEFALSEKNLEFENFNCMKLLRELEVTQRALLIRAKAS
jgi:hypothetical protein